MNSRSYPPSSPHFRAARAPEGLAALTIYNTTLAKLFQRLKKDAGATSVAQNYRGTGTQSYRRQLWVHFQSGAVIDLWLNARDLGLGGVVKNRPPADVEARVELPRVIEYGDKTPQQVYDEAMPLLRAWANPPGATRPQARAPQSGQETATLLQTRDEVVSAKTGVLYIVRSGSEAYYPAMALIEAGYAEQLGELFDQEGTVVTLKVTQDIGGSLTARASDPPEGRRTITIGREFFITALKDYRDWQIKWWREAVQNSVDAGGRNIHLGSTKNPDETLTVYCDDDGSGMDEDTILSKFLVLGATTKVSGSGAAGGFGKAKELLLLPWISWRIHSRDTIVEGAGIDYTVTRGPMRVGTRLEVVMPADKNTDGAIALGFLEKCYLPSISFTVDGKPAFAQLVGGDLVESLPGKMDVYFSRANDKQSYLYVRAKGLFMFSIYVGEIPGFVIAELTAPSIEILTANRDGFRDWDVANSVEKLANRIAKDNMSALRNKQGLIRKKFKGAGKFRARQVAASLLEHIGPTTKIISESDVSTIVATVGDYAKREEERRVGGGGEQEKIGALPNPEMITAMLDQKFLGSNHIEAAIKQLVWEPDFYLMNDIEDFAVPKKFFPETMTPTVLKLAKSWVELCRYVMMQLGSESRFGVGFHFSTDAAASALTDEDENGDRERWLMLNPFKDMDSRKELWRPTQDADLKWLYAAAIHECTHIADGLHYHDESFAAALTRNMAKCADGYRKIRAIVGGIKMRGAPEGFGADADE